MRYMERERYVSVVRFVFGNPKKLENMPGYIFFLSSISPSNSFLINGVRSYINICGRPINPFCLCMFHHNAPNMFFFIPLGMISNNFDIIVHQFFRLIDNRRIGNSAEKSGLESSRIVWVFLTRATIFFRKSCFLKRFIPK